MTTTIQENDLVGKPGQLFNMDESGMPLDAKPPKLVAVRGAAVSAIGSGDKTQITVVACVRAAGYCIPPMVIWDWELTHGEVPGTIYGLSKMGGLIWNSLTYGLPTIFCALHPQSDQFYSF